MPKRSKRQFKRLRKEGIEMLILGSHVSLKGNDMFLGSVEEALSYNANTMMVYTGAPQNTIRKPIEVMKIDEAHALMKANNIDISNVVVHAPYIINLCNPDPIKRAFAVEFLTKEVIRVGHMGINQMVLHPGSAVGGRSEEHTSELQSRPHLVC